MSTIYCAKSALKTIFFTFLALFAVALAVAQEDAAVAEDDSAVSKKTPWQNSLFAELAIQGYAVPELFAGHIKPYPGFRGAVGYEYQHFLFALESGYTHIEGTNPMVLNLKFAPLVLKVGYNFTIYREFGLEPHLSYGFLFSGISHYQKALHLLTDEKKATAGVSAAGGVRLYATYTFLGGFFKAYAGGGIDALFEDFGTIPLPVLEAGVSVLPFALTSKKEASPFLLRR